MKKYKYLLFVLMLFIPTYVQASIGFSCPNDKIETGKEFSCTVFGPEYCSSLQFELELPEGFAYVKSNPTSSYKLISSDKVFSYEGTGLHSRVVTVITILAPTNLPAEKYGITLKNIKLKYTKEDSVETTKENITRNITLKSKIQPPKTEAPTTNKIETYTLSFNENGANTKINPITCQKDSVDCQVDLTKIEKPIKPNYNFTGFSETKNCEKIITSYLITKNTNLYACFKDSNPESKVLYLTSLNIENYELSFSKFKFSYDLYVSTDVNSLKIDAISNDPDVVVTVLNNDNLKLGNNEVIIELIKGELYTSYKINVIKSETDTNKPKETDLVNDIIIKNYSFPFNKEVFNYNLTIKRNESKLDIETVKKEGVEITINGNEDLKSGSVIRITAINDNGDLKEYRINITVLSLFDEYKTYIIIAASIIFAIIVWYIVGKAKGRFDKNKLGTIQEKKPKKMPNEKKNKKPKKETLEKLEL